MEQAAVVVVGFLILTWMGILVYWLITWPDQTESTLTFTRDDGRMVVVRWRGSLTDDVRAAIKEACR